MRWQYIDWNAPVEDKPVPRFAVFSLGMAVIWILMPQFVWEGMLVKLGEHLVEAWNWVVT